MSWARYGAARIHVSRYLMRIFPVWRRPQACFVAVFLLLVFAERPSFSFVGYQGIGNGRTKDTDFAFEGLLIQIR